MAKTKTNSKSASGGKKTSKGASGGKAKSKKAPSKASRTSTSIATSLAKVHPGKVTLDSNKLAMMASYIWHRHQQGLEREAHAAFSDKCNHQALLDFYVELGGSQKKHNKKIMKVAISVADSVIFKRTKNT